MEIKIVTSDFDDVLMQSHAKWKLFAKKISKAALFYLAGSIFFIGLHISDHALKDFWAYDTCVGIALLLFAITSYYHIYKNKVRFLNQAKVVVSKLKEAGKPIEIKITEDAVAYKNFERFIELKWSTFTSYKIYKDYLLIINDESNLSGITFNKNDISSEQLSELFDFMAKRNPAITNEPETKIF